MTDIRIARDIGLRLRELRIEAELSAGEIARRMGTHRPIVSRVEAGRHPQALSTIYGYAAALGVDVRDVVCVIDPGWRERTGWTYRTGRKRGRRVYKRRDPF